MGAIGLIVFILCGRWLGFHWSLTDSVPPGLYRRTHAPLIQGQLIAFCLPTVTAQFGWARGYLHRVPDVPLLRECPLGYQPLLKPIVGLAGDVVELTPDTVIINGTSLTHSATVDHDSQGRPLPHLPWGRYLLAPGEVWVMSTTHPNSWDSRYFGPIREEAVIATATPLWVPHTPEGR
jgi:conjugative transfer signal peptidase TraF